MDVSDYTNVDAVLKDVFSLGKSVSLITKINSSNVENVFFKKTVAPIIGSFSPALKFDTDIVGCKEHNLFDRFIYNHNSGKMQLSTVVSAGSMFVKSIEGYLYAFGITWNMFKHFNAILTVAQLCISAIDVVVKYFRDPVFADNVKQHGLRAFLYPLLSAVACSVIGLVCQHCLAWLALGIGMYFIQQYIEKKDGCRAISDVVFDAHALLKFPLLFTKNANSGFNIASTTQCCIGMLPIIAKLTVNACCWLSVVLDQHLSQLQPVLNAAA